MGAWDELDIELSVDVDTSGLDDLINRCGDDDIFQPAVEIAQKYKTAIDEGSKDGIHRISEKTISYQQRLLQDKNVHPYTQGMLASSIDETEQDAGYSYLVGTRINHIYPMSLEYGADIRPVTKKALKFQTKDGDIVFAKRVNYKPRPYVEPTFDHIKEIAGEWMLRAVAKRMDAI